jgi:hypothetical protein
MSAEAKISDALVVRIGEPDAGRRARLDDHFVAGLCEFPHGCRNQSDTVFMNLYFLGHTDAHGSPLTVLVDR